MNPTTSLVNNFAQSAAQGASPLNSVTPGSANYQPQLAQPSAIPTPDRAFQIPQGAMQGMQQPQQAPQQQLATLPIQDQDPQSDGVQVPANEAELIIKALDGRMKALSKIHTLQTNSMYPQPEQPTQGA